MRIDLASLEDRRLEDYRHLRDRDIARERGGFVAEGWEVVRHLVASAWTVRSVLVARERWGRAAALLESIREETPVLVLPLVEMSRVVGFPIHRGLLAIGERASAPSLEAVLQGVGSGPKSVLILGGVSNHDNVGAAFRNAAAFGVSAILLDDQTADPLYRKALRVSMGHVLRVPFASAGSLPDICQRMSRMGITTAALTPRVSATDVDALLSKQLNLGDRFALLFGREGPGLSPSVIDTADVTLRIRMAGGTDSLNVATACAVVLQVLRHVSPLSFEGGAGLV